MIEDIPTPGQHITVGEALKKQRLAQDVSIETIIEKTKISKKFILLIENDDFSEFPSQLYITGFITNISEVIGLDPEKMVEHYLQDQEALSAEEKKAPPPKTLEHEPGGKPAPLFKPEDGNNQMLTWALAGALVIVLIAFPVYLYINKQEGSKKLITPDNKVKLITPYKMYKESESFDLKKDDMVDIFFNETIQKFKLTSLTESEAGFTISGEEFTLAQEKSFQFDADKDEVNDLEIKLKKLSDKKAIFFFKIINTRSTKINFQEIWDTKDHIKVDKEYILFKNQDRYPISVYIKAATDASFLQYNIDGKRQNTRTLKVGEEISIVADEHIEIGIGHYKEVICIINKIPINLSMDSEKFSITKIIKWVQNPENQTKYDLIIKDFID